MRVQPYRGYNLRRQEVRKGMRHLIKATGIKRPVAVLRARGAVSGLVRRGGIIDVLLDLNRDLKDGKLAECWDYYGEYIMTRTSNGKAFDSKNPKGSD